MTDEEVSQFVSITGSSAEKARFYVESARGDVQEAVSAYFEAEGAEGETDGDDDVAPSTPAAQSVSGPRTLSGAPAPAASSMSSSSTGPVSTAGIPARSAAAGGGGRFASLADYRAEGGRPGANDDDEDDNDERGADDRDPVNFFTGGERSGLSVQNPDHFRRRAGNAPEVVQNILQRARDMSQRRAEGNLAEDEDDDWDDTVQPSVGRGGPAKAKSFGGQGRTLTDASAEGESSGAQGEVPGAFQLAGQGDAAAAQQDEIVDRRIIFWQDGFSLEDGPLCRYDDPQHAHTLSMINNGAAPLSFLGVRFGQRVNLNVEQRHENYKPPPPAPPKPFGGSGNRLGSPAPALASQSTAKATPSSSAPPPAASTFQIDDSQPVTQLQIRLADGQRVVGRFNHVHTVADVRNYINASQANASGRSYALQTSFPPKPIDDESQTLKDAGLINAVVIQKWT